MPTNILGATTGAAGVLLSFLLVTGCATSATPAATPATSATPATPDPSAPVVFTKTGVSAADRQRDENGCLRASVSADDQSRILVPFQVDRSRFRSCMESRGYAATPVK